MATALAEKPARKMRINPKPDTPQKTEGVEVDARTRAYALEVEKKLKELISDEGPKFWTTAELIYEVHDKALWRIRGFESAKHYIDNLYMSKSSWYAKRRLWIEWVKPAMDKERITRARLNRMPSQNVKQLLRLDEKRRFDERWIEKAITMTEANLEELVDKVLENPDKEIDDGNQPEDRALLKISCSVSQKAFVLEVFAKFAEKENIDIDDQGKILELICAEINSGL